MPEDRKGIAAAIRDLLRLVLGRKKQRPEVKHGQENAFAATEKTVIVEKITEMHKSLFGKKPEKTALGTVKNVHKPKSRAKKRKRRKKKKKAKKILFPKNWLEKKKPEHTEIRPKSEESAVRKTRVGMGKHAFSGSISFLYT